MSTSGQNLSMLATLSNDLAEAVDRSARAVVTVEARRRIGATGILWPGDGIVVTADHVVERDEDISVVLPNGERAKATIAGRDARIDVAVLRLAARAGQPAELAPAGSGKVGNLAIAVGRPSGEAPMASFGIISAVGGPWRTARGGMLEGYIRADVTFYPGFSGGPLVDASGRVLGLNTSHIAAGQPFAIPVTGLGNVVQALLSHGRLRRAYLGISSQPVQLPQTLRERLAVSQQTGLMILRVEPGSAADRGGLMIGDVLIAIGGRPIADTEELQAALGLDAVGKSTPITVVRGGEAKELSVTPSELS